MFSCPILKSPLRFSYVEVIAIPATCLVNYLRPLGTIQAIFVWKERFNATSVQKSNFKVNNCQFSRDVTAAMLAYRTIGKKSFGNLIILLCKTSASFCLCFVHQHGRLIT